MREILASDQLDKIRAFEKGFVATHLIHIGAKLGLFEALSKAGEGLTAGELAVQTGLHEPYEDIFAIKVTTCQAGGMPSSARSVDLTPLTGHTACFMQAIAKWY